MKNYNKNYFKYVLGFVICLVVRLIPFRAPNIEPILAFQMPFSKNYGGVSAFLFAFSSIIFYDVFTSGLGMWTFVTAVVYGLLGVWAMLYFKNKQMNSIDFVRFAILGTIVYDVLTGLSVGPLFFHQSLSVAIAGQIPFTLLHLIGNITFAFFLSPIIYKYTIPILKTKSSLSENLLTKKIKTI
jgi:hypothetical protein